MFFGGEKKGESGDGKRVWSMRWLAVVRCSRSVSHSSLAPRTYALPKSHARNVPGPDSSTISIDDLVYRGVTVG